MERNTNTQQIDERNMYGLYASDAILLGENPYAGVEHTAMAFLLPICIQTRLCLIKQIHATLT